MTTNSRATTRHQKEISAEQLSEQEQRHPHVCGLRAISLAASFSRFPKTVAVLTLAAPRYNLRVFAGLTVELVLRLRVRHIAVNGTAVKGSADRLIFSRNVLCRLKLTGHSPEVLSRYLAVTMPSSLTASVAGLSRMGVVVSEQISSITTKVSERLLATHGATHLRKPSNYSERIKKCHAITVYYYKR